VILSLAIWQILLVHRQENWYKTWTWGCGYVN
jgi:hypothetical protein